MHLKSFLLSAVVALISVTAFAQTQEGYVKTRGRLAEDGSLISGKRLAGASVVVKDGNAAVSDAEGEFSLRLPKRANFFLQEVKKQGYALVDMDVLGKSYTYSENPMTLVMDTPDQLLADKLAAERKIRRTLNRQLQAREDEIEQLKAEQKLTQAEYSQALQQLYADQEKSEKLIGDMAARYSTLDFDALDELNRRISDCILNGRLADADSLLRTKGDIHARAEKLAKHRAANAEVREKLEKSELMAQQDLEELAQDCYSRFEICKMRYEQDSAAYYITMRAELDTTNVAWLNEAGLFLSDYLAQSQKAKLLHETALRQAMMQYGAEHPHVATSYNNLGVVYSEQGDYPRALEYHQKALAIWQQVFGAEHPDVAVSYNNLGTVYHIQGDYPRALEYHQKALAIWQQVFGAEHPAVATSYSNLGVVYNNQGDYPRALEYHQKALAIWQQVFGAEHPAVATSYNNLGGVYDNQGDYPHALEYYNKALAIRLRVFGEEHQNVALLYNNIAVVYFNQGDYPRALKYIQKALTILQQVLDANHPTVIEYQQNLEFFRQKLQEAK